jgi:predicted RNA binding protein YcfA (HicA-like mRNA interferase family)
MKLERYQGVKTKDMIRILRRLGYKQVGRAGKVMRYFSDEDGNSISTPVDLDEEIHPKVVWWMVNMIRLPDKEFERLRKAS